MQTGPFRTVFKVNLTVLLILSWIVFAVRDLVPLCTFHGRPVDDNNGILWALIVILTIVGIVIPMIMPRQHVPLDPTVKLNLCCICLPKQRNLLQDVKPPSPQQIASPLSILLFSWLDGLVWRATQVEHIPVAELPPLPDSSHASVLSRRSFSNIDPFAGDTFIPIKRRYIFWGLLRTYRREYIIIAINMVLQAVAALSAPFALKSLLTYLETNGKDAEVRPWVWVALMFLGPSAMSILSQQYYHVYTRVMVHLEGVLTQLILEHALRIRMVAEPERTGTHSNSTPTPTRSLTPTAIRLPSDDDDQETDTPENEASTFAKLNPSVNSSSTAVPSTSASDESTLAASSASINTAKSTVNTGSNNLVGRMNNLISSDLKTIGDAAEFLQPFLLGPCLIIGCIIFLYKILGWSAFVGLAGMILQLPVPIWMAKMLESSTKMVTVKVG